MKNLFVVNPTEEFMSHVEEVYNVKRSIVQADINDVRNVIQNTDNAIAIEGTGSGKHRISNAIEDAVLHVKTVASGFDFFLAEKVLLQVTCSKSNPIEMSEINDICQMAEVFTPNTDFVWSMCFGENDNDMVIARIIASNLKRK